MKRFSIFLFFTFLLTGISSASLLSQDLNGHWEGSLSYGGNNIPLVFNIEQQPGALSATLDSPSQGATNIPVDSVRLKGDSIFLYLPRMGVTYSGRFDKNRSNISGTWKQAGLSLPLNMKKGAASAAKAPSQTPAEPLPYQQEEVRFENKEAGISLAGTFTKPTGAGQFPAVVLISGSGPQDRDETILGHKPFLVLADYLTRQGIAVLRYDDRGFGQSQGNFVKATTADFATDAAAAVQYLQYRPDVKANQIGLIGHSEGALIAPMIAQKENPVAFIVLLAPPVVPIHELMVAQVGAIAKAQEMPQERINQQKQLQGELLSIILHQQDSLQAASQLTDLLRLSYEEMQAQNGVNPPTESQIKVQVAQLLSPWFRNFVAYKPQPALKNLQVPTLALFGEKDVQVPAALNMTALEELQNKNIEAKVFPGKNHLFQPATTGLPQEYGTIETTLAPEVLETIGQWVKDQLSATDE